jgi:hypothetical protein
MFTATIRNSAGAAFATGLFTITPGEASCGVRNGSGINPLEFGCVNAPVIGSPWTLDTQANAGTILTFLVLGFDPAPAPFLFLGGEVLIDVTNPALETYTGPGVYNFNIPAVPAYVGFPLFLQGARVDSGGATFVVLNALETILGN